MSFDELYEKYADGILSDAERAEFQRLLEDPANRARLVEFATYESAISEELPLAAADAKKASSRSWPKVGSRRIPIQAEPEVDEARVLRTIGLVAAAAGLIALLLVFIFSPGSEDPRPSVFRPKQEPPAPREMPPPPPAPVDAPPVAPRADPPSPELTPRTFEATPAPKETPPAPRAPAPKRPEPIPAPKPVEATRESATFVATLERVVGEVAVSGEPGEAGKGIAAGRAVTTGRSGFALVKFPDGSKVEIAADTIVSRWSDGPAGKSALLEQGMVLVDAVKQPAQRPLVITTAQAESIVLGTQFVLQALPGATRIDVREGRVRFTRLPQGVSSVTVSAGQYALAGTSGDPVAKTGIGNWKAPPTGLQMWFRADQGVKPGFWTDLSPAGNSATQDKPGAQPTLVANAHGTRPALRFDGADDYLMLPDGFNDFRAGLTAFVVVRPAPGGSWSRFIDLDIGPQCENIVFGRKDAGFAFWVYTNSLTKGKVDAPGAVVVGEVQCLGAMLSPGGRVTLYRNGNSVAAGETSMPKNTTRKPNYLAKSNSGGDPLFKGEMYEILLYNRALSEAERIYVESYLNAKFFDATTPPSSLRPSDK